MVLYRIDTILQEEKKMRKIYFPIVALMFAVSAVIPVFAADEFGAGAARINNDPSLQEMLTYALQDEYLAHSEYDRIIEEYGTIRPFSNIIRAEETHISLLLPLFKTYGYSAPADTASEHAVMPKDLKTAFEIGVQAEIDNIAMYESFLGRNIPDNVRDVFQRLKATSENHLRAFQNGLKRYQ